ncbi:YkyA family protein [Metabacillus herbersteinensis]|uniref:YkyA family protein n=1 Tax=Metabacillus herbersteinensis TaxID=283816 RepID=A0ABV6GAV1_9BACI
MLVKRNKMFLIIGMVTSALIILSGCMGASPTENIYTTLEKVVTLEDTFKQQQQPLIDLEKKENELYNEIISLGMKEYDQIVSLSKEALTVVEERESRTEKESESIASAKVEFEKISSEIEKIKEEDVQEKANSLKDIMEQRYTSYEKLFDSYKIAIANDKKLYELFQNKELEFAQLEEQIVKINESYKIVLNENEQFNDLTEKYNETKLEFYKQAGLEVEESNDHETK